MPLLVRQKKLAEPQTGSWERFPLAVAWWGTDGELGLNSRGRELLERVHGAKPAAWERWIKAVITRMQAAGITQEVLPARSPGEYELEVRSFRSEECGPDLVLILERETRSGDVQDLTETVSTLSHELRTPLAAIKSSLGLVASGEAGNVTEDQDHFLGMALRNIDRLERLVSDLLDVSRADAGQLAVRCEKCDLRELVGEVVTGAEARAQQKGIGLDLVYRLDDPVGWVDGDKVVQILANLLSNALKYTPGGGQVRVQLERLPGAKDFLLEVRDNGPGMDEETLQRVLQPYLRGREADLNRVKGSGLGLHITQKLAAALGGRMGLDSRSGKGTRAWVRLPAGVASPLQEDPTDPVFDK